MERAAWVAVILGACGGTGPLAPSLSSPAVISASARTVEGTISAGTGTARAAGTIPFVTLEITTTGDGARIGALSAPVMDLLMDDLSLGPLVLIADPLTADVEHAGDDQLDLKASWPIDLVWAMQLLDPRAPVAAPLRPLEADVHVLARADGFHLVVNARCTGACWQLESMGRFGDVFLHVDVPAEVQFAAP